jgi:hypothetical protein
MHIFDKVVKMFRNLAIDLVKLQWTCYSPEGATWKHEDTMQEEYPQLQKVV